MNALTTHPKGLEGGSKPEKNKNDPKEKHKMNSTTHAEIEQLRGLLRELKSSIKPGDKWVSDQRVTLKRSGKSGEWVTHHQNMTSGQEYWGRYFTADEKTGGESGAYVRALKDYLNRCIDLGVKPLLSGAEVVTRGRQDGETTTAGGVMGTVWDGVLEGILQGHVKDKEAANFRAAMVRANGSRRNGGAR